MRYLIASLLISCWFIDHTLAVFNPFDPNQQENFDPAEADPRGNITCLGEAYDLTLPTWNGFNPNGISMQKLCAKTQYGGGPPEQNVGAFCYYLDDTISHHLDNTASQQPSIMFDPSPEARANTVFANPRVLLGCAYRCYCNYGLNNSLQQPRKNPGIHDFHLPSTDTYLLQIDVNDETEPPFYQKPGPYGSHRVKTVGIDSRAERRGNVIEPWFWSEMSLDPGNLIECFGDLPSFFHPPQFRREEFANIQQLCAVQLSFGNGDANAGGYCHRTTTPQGPQNTVWFSDELTPRHDWTWSGGDLRFVASLRWHCSRVCSCWDNPHHDNMTTNLWRILGNLEVMARDRSLYITSSAIDARKDKEDEQSKSKSKSKSKQVLLLPQQPGPAGTCGASGTEFCPLQWDRDAWGPPPTSPPPSSSSSSSSSAVRPLHQQQQKKNTTLCGKECHQQSDCAPPPAREGEDNNNNNNNKEEEHKCSCAVPTFGNVRALGLDPVAPVAAVCVALFAAKLSGGGGGFYGGRMRRREVAAPPPTTTTGYTDAFLMPYTCRCNGSFVGDECCVLF